jgi:hypothetical protein
MTPLKRSFDLFATKAGLGLAIGAPALGKQLLLD